MSIQKIKNYYHLGSAIAANILYGFPSRKMIVIGVTGTDGKTTTANLIYHILTVNKKKASVISTVGAKIEGNDYDIGFHVTTPSTFQLQKYIKKIAKSKSEYLVLEVTSHALDQYRAFGIHFDIGVITNVSHEHLDYHKTYENYVRTKAKLLKESKIAILNRDDLSFPLLSKILQNHGRIDTYGSHEKSTFNFRNFPFKTQLIGLFNRYNILAAATVCCDLGLSDAEIRKGIASFKPPVGRQEIVYNRDFRVMIDFAHTPNSFTSLLPGLKKITKGRLIHVFGAAGKRDSSKRPLMGEASGREADIIILTAEDPRDESVEKINNEIKKGIKNHKKLEEQGKLLSITDRREAIKYAIKMAARGDTVIITGKSHEKSMNLGNGEEPWDEFEVVKKALKQ